MKTLLTYFLCAIGIQLFLTNNIYAQETVLALKAPAKAVIIDGDSKEWGDSLAYYNTEKNLHYTLANDNVNLYLVIKTNDPSQQNSILSSGVKFSIDTKGRKKSAYSTTFPVSEIDDITKPDNSLEGKKLRAELTDLKKIGVNGFKDIDNDAINYDNNYGIQTAIAIDDAGYLTFEEAIPLALFHAVELAKNEWSYNIKLNAVTLTEALEAPKLGYSTVLVSVPAGSGPPSTGAINDAIRGSSSRQRAQPQVVPTGLKQTREIEVSKAIDFWGKFSLAKND